MTFDWSLYLKLAEQLVDGHAFDTDEEARYRCAISRSYYAAFCSARNFLRDAYHMELPKSAKAHNDVARRFQEIAGQDESYRTVFRDLGRLRTSRNDADYEDTFPGNLRKKATSALTRSRRILDVLTPRSESRT